MKNEKRDIQLSLFNELVESNKKKIHNIAYRFTGNHDDAKDITQEVYKKAWENIDQLRDTKKAEKWIVSIAYNICKNFVTRRFVADELLHDVEDREKEKSPYETEIKNALSKLSDERRIAIILLEYDDRSYKEIAEIMKISQGKVKTVIHRARMDLKNNLKAIINNRSGL